MIHMHLLTLTFLAFSSVLQASEGTESSPSATEWCRDYKCSVVDHLNQSEYLKNYKTKFIAFNSQVFKDWGEDESIDEPVARYFFKWELAFLDTMLFSSNPSDDYAYELMDYYYEHAAQLLNRYFLKHRIDKLSPREFLKLKWTALFLATKYGYDLGLWTVDFKEWMDQIIPNEFSIEEWSRSEWNLLGELDWKLAPILTCTKPNREEALENTQAQCVPLQENPLETQEKARQGSLPKKVSRAKPSRGPGTSPSFCTLF